MLFRSFLRICCALLAISVSSFALAQSSLDAFVNNEGAFLSDIENQRALATQVLQATTAQRIATARNQFDSDPDQAVADLKQAMGTVERAADVPVEVRTQLRGQLVTSLQQGQRRAADMQLRDQEESARRAAGQEQRRILRESVRSEEKLAQIIARYNALLDEGRYRDAEEAAYQARDIAPSDPTIAAAILTARTTGYVRDMMAVREARQRGVVDALFRVEQANVPFGDEPPIVYPDSQIWENLTLRRAKYAAMSLDKQGSAEERIFNALNDATTMEFIEMPLQDVIDYLKDLHGIEIQINYRALEEVGIGAGVTVTRNLKGISLRSALKLMLRELDLTYIVRDEVLQITTPEDVEDHLTTKVYPVADLVLPITSGAGANPFQMGAGLNGPGGFGAQQGQQGGGNNQMQGGNFGNLLDNPIGGPIF